MGAQRTQGSRCRWGVRGRWEAEEEGLILERILAAMRREVEVEVRKYLVEGHGHPCTQASWHLTSSQHRAEERAHRRPHSVCCSTHVISLSNCHSPSNVEGLKQGEATKSTPGHQLDGAGWKF